MDQTEGCKARQLHPQLPNEGIEGVGEEIGSGVRSVPPAEISSDTANDIGDGIRADPYLPIVPAASILDFQPITESPSRLVQHPATHERLIGPVPPTGWR